MRKTHFELNLNKPTNKLKPLLKNVCGNTDLSLQMACIFGSRIQFQEFPSRCRSHKEAVFVFPRDAIQRQRKASVDLNGLLNALKYSRERDENQRCCDLSQNLLFTYSSLVIFSDINE